MASNSPRLVTTTCGRNKLVVTISGCRSQPAILCSWAIAACRSSRFFPRT